MRLRIAALVALPLILLPLLTACDPAGTPEPEGAAAESEQPTEPIVALPEDAVMAVTALATAGNGAALDISLIVHAPQPFNADGAADAWAATTAWCVGEIDDSIISDQGFSFTTVEVTATTRAGDWPVDTPLSIQPQPWPGTTTASGGDLIQVNASYDTNLEAGVVPHCAQPVLLPGPGVGELYLGIVGDIDGDGAGTIPLGGWANFLYGVNSHTPEGDSDVTLSECTVRITELGGELGAPTPDWQEHFENGICTVGGVSGQG